MKKLLLILTIFALFLPLSAKTLDEQTFKPFEPLSVRSEAMGGSGIANPGRSDTFFLNPAGFCLYNGQLSLPYVGFRLYNINSLAQNGFFSSLSKGDMTNAGVNFVTAIQSGYLDLAAIDLGFSFSISDFGLGVNSQVKLSTIGPGTVGSTVIAETNLVGNIGYAHLFELNGGYSIALGVNVKFNYLAYTTPGVESGEKGGFSASRLVSVFSSPDPFIKSLLNGVPVAGGFSVPVDCGLILSMPHDFSFGFAVRNINGGFAEMNTYNGFSSLLYEITNIKLKDSTITDKVNTFSITTPIQLDLGFAWAPPEKGFFKYIKPSLALDFVDAIGFFENELSWEQVLLHIKMGIELRVLRIIDLRAGLNQGYPSLGASLDLAAFRVDALYSVKEYGYEVGNNPLDALTIRFNIGFDR